MGRLTLLQTATRLDRSAQLVRRWLRDGRLRGEKIGRDWFVQEREIERFVRSEPERRATRR